MRQLIERVLETNGRGEFAEYRKISEEAGLASYGVVPAGESVPTLAVTVISNPSLWWKVGQAQAVEKIVGGDSKTRLPKMLNSGFDLTTDQKFAFIVREFVPGKDLDATIASLVENYPNNWRIGDLAKDLGSCLGAIHSHQVSTFGFIGRNDKPVFLDWKTFLLSEVAGRIQKLALFPADKKIGEVRVVDILNVVPGLSNMLGTVQESLSNQKAVFFGHGDAHFRNFVANDNGGQWQISGVIDTDEAVGGDPEVDIASLENWLHCSSYQHDFYHYRSSFNTEYRRFRQPSESYADRRLIYHALRSLAYLQAVFAFDPEYFVKANSNNTEYVRRHFEILVSLANNNRLEDIQLFSLI